MKNNPAIEWTILPSWPVSVHICDIEGIHHPLTPEQVRQFYETTIKNLEVVVWTDKVENLLGFKAGISEHVWKINEIEKVTFRFARPAKGAGFFWLSVNKADNTEEAIAGGDSYSDSILFWFRSVIDTMKSMAHVRVEEVDIGYDA